MIPRILSGPPTALRVTCLSTLLICVLATSATATPRDPTAFTSNGDLSPFQSLWFDTDALTLSIDGFPALAIGVLDGDDAVFVFDNITVDSAVGVTVDGTASIAILAQGDIDWAADIDLSASGSGATAGGFSQNSGAGAGSSGGGAFGGDGGSGTQSGGTAYGDLSVELEGGSGGGSSNGAGGAGGGALELGAAGDLTIQAGADFVSNGAVGSIAIFDVYAYAGGGGSGGGFLLHGATGQCAGTITVEGGDGGYAYSSLIMANNGGGGGGGGRIRLLGLDGCTTAVDGGIGGGADDNGPSGQPGAAGTVFIDADLDGQELGVDCDDGDGDNFFGNTEICDGADNDCDGVTAADDVDADGDGVPVCAGDCDDADIANFPGNAEVCDDADNDCDGSWGGDELDDDGDGQTECDGDCDDADIANFLGNPEVCDDADNDCDGLWGGDELDGDNDGQTE